MKYRFLLGIINLLILAFYLVRPALPFLEYILNKHYIEKHLCIERENPENTCHGKCHLQKELQDQAKTVEETPDRKNPQDRKAKDHLKTDISQPHDYAILVSVVHYFPSVITGTWNKIVFVPPES